MNKIFSIRKLLALFIIMNFVILMVSCSQKDTSAEKTQMTSTSAAAQTSVVSPSETPKEILKTDAVLDIYKHKGQLTISFLDPKYQGKSMGDAILIKSPDDVVMLVDAAEVVCEGQVADFLKKMKVSKIDYAVATHFHNDHIGGYLDVLNRIPVGKMLMPDMPKFNTTTYGKFIGTLGQKNIKTEYIGAGDEFYLGKDVKVEVLNPEKKIIVPEDVEPSKDIPFVNERSLIIKITYGKRTFLLTGDVYRTRELELVDQIKDKLNADVIKVPHHGLNTSSTKEFVDAVSAQIAVMTHNMPDISVYDRYKNAGSKVYIQGFDGNILLTSDGDKINVLCEKERKSTGVFK